MPGEIHVNPGLVPYHFAGMVPNPSADTLTIQPQTILIIGAHETGVAATGVQPVNSYDEIERLYKPLNGDKTESTIVKMLKAAFDINPMIPKFAIAVSGDVNPVKARWDFTFELSTIPTAPGSIVFGVCGSEPVKIEFKPEDFSDPHADPEADPPVLTERDYPIKALSEKIRAALAGEVLHKVSVSQDGRVLSLESRSFNTMSNEMAVGIKSQLPGLKINSQFTPGVAAVGDMDAVIAALPYDQQFTQIASSFNEPEEIKTLDDELQSRWNDTRQIDGHLFVADRGTVSELRKKYSEDSAKKFHVTIMATSDSETEPAVWAATVAAVNASHAYRPYLPYSSLPLGRKIQAPLTRYTLAEKDQLLKAGISTHRVVGGAVQIERIVTYYTDDKAYQDLNKKQILSFLRYDFIRFLKDHYPRHALSADETQADGDVATPMSARDLVIARHNAWKNRKYVQDPGKEFKKLIRVKIDEEANDTLRFYLPVQLMGQLRRTITTLAYTP